MSLWFPRSAILTLSTPQGYTNLRLKAPIVPHTTIRGAASLDWTKRPGNYAQVWNGDLNGKCDKCALYVLNQISYSYLMTLHRPVAICLLTFIPLIPILNYKIPPFR